MTSDAFAQELSSALLAADLAGLEGFLLDMRDNLALVFTCASGNSFKTEFLPQDGRHPFVPLVPGFKLYRVARAEVADQGGAEDRLRIIRSGNHTITV